MNKFLNRLLGLEVELQNALFQYFSDTLDAVIKRAKKLGRYDLGIMGMFGLKLDVYLFIGPLFFPFADLTSDIGKVERIEHRTFLKKHSTGAAKIEFHAVAVERGMSWEEAKNLWSQCTSPEEGFYLTSSVSSVCVGKQT